MDQGSKFSNYNNKVLEKNMCKFLFTLFKGKVSNYNLKFRRKKDWKIRLHKRLHTQTHTHSLSRSLSEQNQNITDILGENIYNT